MLDVHIFSVNLWEHYLFGTSVVSWLVNSVICFVLIYWIIWPLSLVPLLDWFDYRSQKKNKMITLELTPPSVNDTRILLGEPAMERRRCLNMP